MQSNNKIDTSEGKLNAKQILSEYPFSIASCYKKLQEKEKTSQKITAIFEVYEYSLIFTSLIVLSMYYKQQEQDGELNEALKKCGRFANGWLPIFQKVIDKTHSNPLLEDIKKWFSVVEQQNQLYLKEIIDYNYVEKNIGHLTNLQGLRNSILNSLHALEEKELDKIYDFYSKSLSHMLAEFSFFLNYPLYWVESRSSQTEYIARKLVGADRNFQRITITTDTPLTINYVYIHIPATNTFQSLHPLIVYQECYYCIKEELLDTFEVFFFQGKTSKKLCYTGPHHHLALREHHSAYTELTNQHKSPLSATPSVKEIWERAFFITDENLKELKSLGILEKYFPRKNSEFILESFIKHPTYPLFNLVGGKGVGKTVLLAEMARRWSTRGSTVFFLRASNHHLNSLEEYLEAAIGKNILNADIDENNKWILIFDGVENVGNVQEFMTELIRLVKTHKNKLKVIVSIQEIFYKHYKKSFSSRAFMTLDGLCPLFESSQKYYLLKDFPIEVGKDLYQTIASRRVGPITPYDSFPRNVKGMLLNPSIAHVFLWALKNRELPRHLGLRDIMEGFVMHHLCTSKARKDFIESFSELLVKDKTSSMDLDAIVATDNTGIIQHALSFAGDGVIQQLNQDGIIERAGVYEEKGSNIILRIPISVVREYLIYRSVALAGKHGDEFLAEYFKDIANGSTGLLGVVYFALIRLADKYYFDRLVKVINQTGTPNKFAQQILLDILVFKEKSTSGRIGHGGAIDDFLESALQEPNQECLLALSDFAIKLYGERKYSSAAFVFEKLIPFFPEPVGKYDPLLYTIIAARGYQKSGDPKKALKLYKKSYKMLKRIENADNEIEIYHFLSKAHRELGDLEKAKFLLERCVALRKNVEGTVQEAYILEELGFFSELQKKYDEALKYFQKQQEIMEHLHREDKEAEVMENIARVLYSKGAKEESLEMLEEAIEIYQDIGDFRRMASGQKQLAKVMEKEGQTKDSIKIFLKALVVFESLEDQAELSDIYISLGRLYDEMDKKEESKDYFNKAMNILREIGDNVGLAECFERFGQLEFHQGNYKDALEKLNKSLEIYKRLNSQVGQGNIYNHLGNLYKAQGDITKAFQYYTESGKIRHALKDLSGLAETYNSLVVVLAHSKKFPAAMEKLQECRSIYQEVNDIKGLATTKATEALLHKLQSDNSKALECYQECAHMLESINEPRLLGTIYNSIGLIYKERGDFYNALSHFEKSVKLQKSSSDLAGLAASYNNIGLIYDAKNDYEKALEFYGKDLEITKKLGDKRGLATSYNNIAILHYNHKNYARALWYLEKSIPLYEEIGEKNMVKKVKERIQYVREKL